MHGWIHRWMINVSYLWIQLYWTSLFCSLTHGRDVAVRDKPFAFIGLHWIKIEQVVELMRAQNKHTQRITCLQTRIGLQGLYVSDLWPWLTSVVTGARVLGETGIRDAVTSADCTLHSQSLMSLMHTDTFSPFISKEALQNYWFGANKERNYWSRKNESEVVIHWFTCQRRSLISSYSVCETVCS